MEGHKKCLIDALNVLKISSKESVENLNEFSSFKEYMHVKRNMQDELVDKIREASKSNSSQLILVCGSVGDGKSHLISYIKHHYPEEMNAFYLHNDASESFDPTKTSMDTLNDVLDGFSDEKLDNSEIHKVIVAINLGTLNNFIESKYQERFTKLKAFVKAHRIIESSIEQEAREEATQFHYVNFTDYHLYTLTEKGAKSSYLDELLLKIGNQDEENYFYNAYCTYCESCKYDKECPVQANYEMIQNLSIRKGVITALIKTMIKEKLIISTRDVLNFFFDILTAGLSKEQLLKLNESKETADKLIEQGKILLINNIFEGKERSHVLDKVALVDSLNYLTEEDEERLIKYQLSNDVGRFLKEDIKELSSPFVLRLTERMSQLADEKAENYSSYEQKVKRFAFTMYKRSRGFIGLNEEDELYTSFMRDLYYRNRGYKSGLKDIFKEVKTAIYMWDGSIESDGIRILSSKRHKSLGIYEPVEIKYYLKGLVDSEKETLERFVPYLSLEFIREGANMPVRLDMDFNLYVMIKKLNHGYIINQEEYRKNIAFQGFIEKLISEDNGEEKELIFEDTSSGKLVKYRLVYNTDFEEYEFKVK